MKKHAFISHIHEEAQVAEYIKSWLESMFQERLEVFVSSRDLEAGSWLAQVRSSLLGANLMFPLLSVQSMDRPWVNFETGCAFTNEGTQIIPLCHKDMRPSGLKAPYNVFQSYDLSDPGSVAKLVQYLQREMEFDSPFDTDVLAFCQEVKSIDSVLYRFYHSLGDLQETAELHEPLAHVTGLTEVPVHRVSNWDHAVLRLTVYDHRTIELSGSSDSTLGFTLFSVSVPKTCQYLVVEFSNTENAVSRERDKFLKLEFNNHTARSVIQGHRHYDDQDFSIKGNGLFVYQLPPAVHYFDVIKSLKFAFWRIHLDGVLMRLYLA